MSDPTPSRRFALYAGLCVAGTLFCLMFAAPAVTEIRVLWYYPLEHRWALELKPTGLAMDWFGRNLLALAVALPGGAIAAWIARRAVASSARAAGLLVAWMATAAVLTMALYSYQLALRKPKPAPLPEWYESR